MSSATAGCQGASVGRARASITRARRRVAARSRSGVNSTARHRYAAAADAPLTLLYFGDTQNKNASLSTRVLREAHRHAPDARLALFAGDLVSGGDGEEQRFHGATFRVVWGGARCIHLCSGRAGRPVLTKVRTWRAFGRYSSS